MLRIIQPDWAIKNFLNTSKYEGIQNCLNVAS